MADMQKSLKYIGLVFISFQLHAQDAFVMNLYVNRVELDTTGSYCSFQPVLLVFDLDRALSGYQPEMLGILTVSDTIALVKQQDETPHGIQAIDQCHGGLFNYKIYTNKDGLIIFVTKLEGEDRFGLVLSTKPCEKD